MKWRQGVCLDKQGNKQNQACKGEEAEGMLRKNDARWPGLSRSESIRLSVERAQYFATLDAEEIAVLADKYAPILRPALEGFGYKDYRAVSRALPAIVEGFIRENTNVTWRSEGQELKPDELVKKLSDLPAVARIRVLDRIVARRHRDTQEDSTPATDSPRAPLAPTKPRRGTMPKARAGD